LTGVKEGTLRQWKARGKLPASERLGNLIVWKDTPQLRAWIEKEDKRWN
jgi:hypothetical protein